MGGDGALTTVMAPWMAVPSLRQCKQWRQPRKALFNIKVAKGQRHLGPSTGELQRWHGGCSHPSARAPCSRHYRKDRKSQERVVWV